MFWTEKADHQKTAGSERVQDLSFRITCRELPTDHAWTLYRQIRSHVPWIEHEPHAGIHGIYGAASGNGWTRPVSGPGSMIHLSHRTRLILRLPASRIQEAVKTLENQCLDIGGLPMEIGNYRCRKLSPSSTIFARSVASDHIHDEERFTHEVLESLESLGIHPGKVLCGLAHTISAHTSQLHAKSVLFSDLDPFESVALQESGLGRHGLLGCGIFLPYKNLSAVHEVMS